MSESNEITTADTKVIKTFNTVSEMKECSELSVGMLCRTLGYREKSDGGGALYFIESAGNEVANEMDIIAIGNKANYILIARYLDEGKPVNVLQFGARNYYRLYIPSTEVYPSKTDSKREDSAAIQRAIDYTVEKLYQQSNGAFAENTNVVVIPGGNYIIRKQIKIPPYISIRLEGNVQFSSFVQVTPDEVVLYKYDAESNTMIPLEIIESDDNGEVKREYNNEALSELNEVFAKTSELNHRDFRNVYDDEYYVYKMGVIKVCYGVKEVVNPDNSDDVKLCIDSPYFLNKFNYSGDENPVAVFNGSRIRFDIDPSAQTDIFCGDGTLSILNKVNNGGNPFCYQCGIEIGSTEEYAGITKEKFIDGDRIIVPKNEKIETAVRFFTYANLKFSKIKISSFNVGIISHAINFYTNVFSDIEFKSNRIGFQFGLYGEDEKLSASEENGKTTMGILGQGALNCGEMNHFRDCLFTDNKISVNILLSSFSATFTSCHFDFDNCIFHAAYRTNLTMDKCHIEGIGKKLGNKYFKEKLSNNSYKIIPITSDMMLRFKNRATEDKWDEYVGIMYAKPITKFTGKSVDQYSYVDLNITSSRIIDNVLLSWPYFSYYDDTNGEMTSDGHHRSNLYLNNNTYAIGNEMPVSYLTSETNGIVSSGFILSEYPERKIDEDAVGTEKDAIQNIPVTCKDSNEWRSYVDCDKPRGNHRFLSNRTLANKYPYLQNISYSGDDGFEGVNVSVPGDSKISDIAFYDGRGIPDVFKKYVSDAKMIKIPTKQVTTETIKLYQDQYNKGNDIFPKVNIEFYDDVIECRKGDTICSAVITNRIAYNTEISDAVIAEEEKNTITEKAIRRPIRNSITVVELDDSGSAKGSYKYEIPYGTSEKEEFEITYTVSDDTNNTGVDVESIDDYDYDYSKVKFPCTTAFKHIVVNENTTKIKLILNANYPLVATSVGESDAIEDYCVCALFVEKNI